VSNHEWWLGFVIDDLMSESMNCMRRLRQVEEAAELVDGQIWATVTKTRFSQGYADTEEVMRRGGANYEFTRQRKIVQE